jgi:NTE family protein
MAQSISTVRSRPRIGLALGGGGARGLGHVLMLEAFEELGIRPHAIAGTSIGAIFGAAYAAGLPAKLIRAHTEEVLSQRFDLVRQLFSSRAEPVQRLLGVLQLRSALLNPATLLDYILPSRVPMTFAELVIPLKVVATDFYAQEAVVMGEGPLRSAVAASMALPALFSPVQRDGRVLMDGGLVNPLPFDVIGPEVDVTVAVDVSGMPRISDGATLPSAMEALVASSQILQRAIVTEKLKSRRPDVYVDVDVDKFHVLEFHRVKDVMAASEPAKARLKRQLERILGAETVAGPALEDVELKEIAPRKTAAIGPPKADG